MERRIKFGLDPKIEAYLASIEENEEDIIGHSYKPPIEEIKVPNKQIPPKEELKVPNKQLLFEQDNKKKEPTQTNEKPLATSRLPEQGENTTKEKSFQNL